MFPDSCLETWLGWIDSTPYTVLYTVHCTLYCTVHSTQATAYYNTLCTALWCTVVLCKAKDNREKASVVFVTTSAGSCQFVTMGDNVQHYSTLSNLLLFILLFLFETQTEFFISPGFISFLRVYTRVLRYCRHASCPNFPKIEACLRDSDHLLLSPPGSLGSWWGSVTSKACLGPIQSSVNTFMIQSPVS